MFSHRGDYNSQIDLIGCAPDQDSDGWQWQGQDGTSGPELEVEGEDKTPVNERTADVFQIHPTTQCGPLWNMPADDTQQLHGTNFYIDTEASVFNKSCRIFAPKYRQCVIAGMAFVDEGKLATELAYLDLKKAFEHQLSHENKGRPFILASHSQGSLQTLRLMLDFIEGKELYSQFIACQGIAAWAPLSLFKGPNSVFKQIKLCQSATDTGCYISWTCETPSDVQSHCETKDANQQYEDWYPQMGHKVGPNDWRIAHGEAIACTNPLTWKSNDIEDCFDTNSSNAEIYKGMLNILDGCVIGDEGVDINDLDTIIDKVTSPNEKLKIVKIKSVIPDEYKSGIDDSNILISAKSGDLQILPLSFKYAGSYEGSMEHLNFILFWFNIRENVNIRVSMYNK